ncbi:hypothetical protein GQ43DRAFT_441379 [Delitschia confertaspora ATCC 74209]|uniref:Histone acetyltransferases subunit 3 n=1 Tax=Delitschia confertaspora ATCC 74209 TaxID=1513339 RepID=A0A9P4JLW3_9PLEO|nr:hypothetical protein GQ43DRAFT_441379 [Delitschia confertaspora ATCC 74209]
MPPVTSKPQAKSKNPQRDHRTQRSRNTTPVSTSNVQVTVEHTPSQHSYSYFRSNMSGLFHQLDTTVEKVLDRDGTGPSVPSVAALSAMRETIQNKIVQHIRIRGETSDRVLRELSRKRKERFDHERERETERVNRETEERKHKLKKVSRKREPEEDRPMAVGAHGVARQDGVDVHKEPSSTVSSPISQAPPSAVGTGPADQPSPSGSEASHQPAPAPAVPHYQTFGPDPSTFDDPTIYHIREVTPGMTEDEIKEIYCVADYPPSDLHELTPGTPPDKDFSNAKPATQVNATVFANYVEPFIRPLTEEDVAFLKERGDRLGPFLMPRRGPRHYKEIWADEDGSMALDTHTNNQLPPNEPRGTLETMNDDVTETEEVSTGPLLARLISTLRDEGRGPPRNNSHESNGINGDTDMDDANGADANPSLPAAAQLPEFLSPGWKAPPVVTKTDYTTLEERTMAELKHMGFFAENEVPDFDAHNDDEVAARLRILQEELRKQSIINGARKARLLELTEERMAQQEYSTIADDLDNQLNAAYLKRNRNIGKGKKNVKRPGGGGGGSSHAVNGQVGVSRPGVGEPIRTLMERKSMWNHTIGPVVNYGKTGLPQDTIFEEEKMKTLADREQEMWDMGED